MVFFLREEGDCRQLYALRQVGWTIGFQQARLWCNCAAAKRQRQKKNARQEAGRYAELVHALDAGITFHPVACPGLVPLIEGDDPYGEETERAVREYAAPLQAEGVDTVILGCTHYPLIRKIFERVFGRDVTLVFSAEETAREVAETLARKGVENERRRDGAYRFLTTGDPAAFRELGRRFLQLPVRDVEHITVATLEAAA